MILALEQLLLSVIIDPWSIGISAGIFAFIVLMVTTMFSQGGEIHLSPEREAAIATGHTDRKTVFEKPFLRALMWTLLGISHRMAIPRTKQWIRKNLVAAGSPCYYTAEEYLALSLLTGLILAFFLELMSFFVTSEISMVVFLSGLVMGTVLNIWHIYNKAQLRMRSISKKLPYVLDLVSLAMGAGATFVEAVRTVVRERGDDPLITELRAALSEMELGTTRRKALENMAARSPLEGMRSLVSSVIHAEELGTPLHKVLHDQATLLRLQRSVHAENAAAVASVRILVPCLLIVIAVILGIFGPAIVRGLQGGLF